MIQIYWYFHFNVIYWYEILLQSKKSALLILNLKEANTNYGCGVWFPCVVDATISKIHSLRDKSRDGVFGTFDYVIMAQDYQCLDQSNKTNSNSIMGSEASRVITGPGEWLLKSLSLSVRKKSRNSSLKWSIFIFFIKHNFYFMKSRIPVKSCVLNNVCVINRQYVAWLWTF